MDSDWTLVVTVVAGASLIGVIGLTVFAGRRFQRVGQQLLALVGEGSAPGPLQAQLEQASERLANLNDTIAWLEQSRREAEAATADVASALEAQRAESATTVQALAGWRQEVEALQAQRQALVDEASRVRDGLERERQVQTKVSAEIATAQERRADLLASIKELTQRREAMIEDGAILARDLGAQRTELAATHSELEAQRAALKDLSEIEATAGAVRETLIGDREALDALARETAALQQRRAESLAVVGDIEQRREALAEERFEAQRDRDAARVEVVHLRAEGAAITRDLEVARVELARLRDESAEITADLEIRRAGFVTSYTETKQRHAALTREVAALDRERQMLAGRVAALRAAVAPSPPKPAAVVPSPPKPAAVAPRSSPLPPVSPPAASGSPQPQTAVRTAVPQKAQPSAVTGTKSSATPAPASKGPVRKGPAGKRNEPAAVALVRDTMKTIDATLTSYLFGKPAPKRRPTSSPGKVKPS